MMLSQILLFLENCSSAFLVFMRSEIIYSTIIFLLVFALKQLLGRRSLHLQYGLLAFVFLRLLLPPGFSLSLSARSLFHELDLPRISESVNVNRDFAADTGFTLAAQTPAKPQQSRDAMEENAASTGIHRSINYLKMSLLFAWCLGVMVFSGLFIKRYMFYRRVIRESEPVTLTKFITPLEVWRKRFNIRRPVKLVTSPECLFPFTLGILKPIIYLPQVLLLEASKATVESVVAHELVHIQNKDDLWIKIQNIVQIAYFFHPVVWFTNSQINAVRERICDQRVLSFGKITPTSYGGSMLAVLKMNLRAADGVGMLPGFGSQKKKLNDRISRIAKTRSFPKSNILGVTALLLVLGILFLPMAQTAAPKAGDNGTTILRRVIDGESGYKIYLTGAGSRFRSVSNEEHSRLFCSSKLPGNLSEIEYAAIGLFDTSPRRVWVLKGQNPAGETEFYLDTNGDQCFTDERPLQIKSKTAKYNYEGSSEWVMSKIRKSRVSVDYAGHEDSEAQKLSVFLMHLPDKNLLQFMPDEFWLGKADFAGEEYDIALYGGMHASWFMYPFLDDHPEEDTANEIRIDLNRNGFFEEMTVFDPERNEVVREKYHTNEHFLVDGRHYRIDSLRKAGSEYEISILPVLPNSGS